MPRTLVVVVRARRARTSALSRTPEAARSIRLLRIHVGSRVGMVGVKAFADTGATWAAGERLRKQQFDRGIGTGVYFGATAVSANLDVAWPERGEPRLHAEVGVAF